MKGRNWVELILSCMSLINFVHREQKKNNQEKKIPFNLEKLSYDDEYKKFLAMLKKRVEIDAAQISRFDHIMRELMDVKRWRILIHWILDYEMAILDLNPIPPMPWPSPLYQMTNIAIPDKLMMDFVNKYPVPLKEFE